MSTSTTGLVSLALLALSLQACGYYEKRGYGWVAKSKLEQPTPVVLPVEAPSISQRFRPATGPASSNHRGFDILVPSGTPVLAAADGRVARVSFSGIYGRQLLLDHTPGGTGLALQTRYFHLSEKLVIEGERVRRGQLLGYSGLSGLTGVFPHLHFEVHRLSDDDPPRAIGLLDPQLFWVDGSGQITCYDRGRDFTSTPELLTYPVPCRGIDWR